MTVKLIFIVALLLGAAIVDLKQRKIPDIIPCLILGVGLIDLHIGRSLLGIAFTGLPYFMVALITSRDSSLSVGGGDIKLASACAFAFSSVSFSILQNIVALLLAIVYGLLIKKSKKEGLPLAPFLFIGSLVVLFLKIMQNKVIG